MESFHRDGNRPSGRYTYCKDCVLAYQRIRRNRPVQRFFGEHATTLEATREATAIDIAWAAGFLEGEGSFGCRRSKRGAYPSVTAPQVNKDPLLRLLAIFGGQIGWRESIHVWYVSGERARWVVSLVYEHLSEKRKAQADASHARPRRYNAERHDTKMAAAFERLSVSA